MTQSIQNGISSLENLFSVNTFYIPEYQRAYSWEEDPQLAAFLEDLRQQVKTQAKFSDKHYFLGTLLLHEENRGDKGKVVNVVDGQQRMTTSVVFVATALKLHREGKISLDKERPTLLRRQFVSDDEAQGQKFHTIREDEAFFQSRILGISSAEVTGDSPSARLLQAAAGYFSKHVAANEWEPFLAILRTAKVMVYAVASAEDATQIFELQNDRGKPLTSLEALKSFLMHCIYLHSNARTADGILGGLQTEFSKIFRTIETLSEVPKAPGEDQLLANHCAAFLQWGEKEYNNPKQLVKSIIKQLDDRSIVGWIQQFVSALKMSYLSIQDMLGRRDSLPEFSELLLLGRMGSYWPLLLKAWEYDDSAKKQAFLKTCRLLEVFTFRGHAIASLRSDTGLSTFQILARDFVGEFEALFGKLRVLCHSFELEKRFEAGLDDANFYAWGPDARYLLWRYENHLRDLIGQKQPQLRWQDYAEPRSHAASFSLEHICAQDNPMTLEVVEWTKGKLEVFSAVALHRLGNLVIDSVSPNASKGSEDLSGKLHSLSQASTYLSQGELTRFLADPKKVVWDVEAVRKRHDHLVAFARRMWNPDTWHTPGAEAVRGESKTA